MHACVTRRAHACPPPHLVLEAWPLTPLAALKGGQCATIWLLGQLLGLHFAGRSEVEGVQGLFLAYSA